MKRKIGKRARLLAFLLAAIVMLTSFSFSSVYAEENQVSDMVQKEINTDSPGEEGTTEEDKEPEKDLEKDLEIERQMKQLLKEIGVGFAESDAQANTSSMPRRAKATRAAGETITTGALKKNIGRIDVINYNDPSWPRVLTWGEGRLGNTDTKEPLFCADPMDNFKAGKKTGVDASTIYNKETIQTLAAMMYYYDHYMCKSINSDYEYLMKQCAVWWVLNAVHGWFADGVQIETGNGVDCACGTSLSAHKGDYYKKGLVWAAANYKYFTDAKGVIYQGEGQPLSSWSGTYNPKTYTSLAVKKIWDDQENKFGLRPSAVTVDLYWWSNVDSTRYYYKTAELTAANNWTVTWDNLERSDGNVMYEYTAVEREVPNYSSEMQWYGSYENGWTGTLTNKLKTYTSLSVKKLWDDQENQFELQPSSIKVNLYWWSNKDSTRHYYKTATLSAENNWFVTWDNLEYVDGDTTYGYDVEEEEVSEYTGKMQWTGSYKDGWVGSLTNSLKTGNAKVLKTSTSPELTDGNDCYSLKDAVYGIYTTADCKESSLVALMTTKENGESDAVTVPIGTYHVKEVTAPKGYALDKKIHTVEIKLGETYLLKVSDKPTMDPVGVLLGKIDKETNQNKPEGSLPMEGALFEVKFYAGVQMDSDPAADGKKANKTWVFKTDQNGMCRLENKYLVSGDELYKTPTGNTQLPMGTLTFKETQAPEGYLLNPEIYTVKITSSNDGSEFVYTYNAPEIPEQSLDLNLVKKEQGKDYVIEGVVFELTKPDGSTETATTAADGTCKFKALGYGQHKVREISAPDGYAVNEGIVTFSVAKDNTITVDSNTSADESMQFSVESDGTALLSVEDTLSPYKLKITKVNEKGTTLEDAEFTIYEDKECKHELDKIVTDKTGIATTNLLAVEKLYYIKETKAPQGYRIPQDAQGKDYVYEIYTKINDQKQYEYYVNGQVHTEDSGDFAIEGTANERIVNLKVENQTTLQMPNTGTHTTLLIVLLGISCMTVALIRQTKRGKKEKKDEKSEKL